MFLSFSIKGILMKKLNFLMFIAALALGFSSCGDDDSDSSPVQYQNIVDVDFTDETKYFDESALVALKSYDLEDNEFIFDEDDELASSIEEGDILFLYGIAMGRVDSITNEDGEIIIKISYAGLNELIKDGTLSWSREIEFTNDIIPQIIEPSGKRKDFTLGSGDTLEAELTFEEYSGKIQLVMNTDHASAFCELTKKVGSANVSLKFEGKVNKFVSAASMNYKNSTLQNFNFINQGTDGELTLTMIATGSNDNLYSTKEFPVVLLRIPFVIGGIPVELRVKLLFLIDIYMPTADCSSWVSAKFKYNSDAGISFDGVDAGIKGQAGNYTVGKEKAQTGGSTAVGANFGIGFPQIEMSMFGNIVIPWVRTAFLIGGFYETGTSPCQLAQSSFIGACGYNFEFLGFKMSGSKTIWNKTDTLLKSGDCD